MTDHTVAIIQARMGSTRFPGKMTAPFLERPILSWVIKRLQRCQELDDIILATTNHARDQVLIDMAREHGILTFAGDEQNVLQRFVDAARLTSADTVVRVCADNPLIAPEAVDQLIDFYRSKLPDYAFNNVPKGTCHHPDGFGAEILNTALLNNILRHASQPEHFEHVTSYIWNHPDQFDIQAPECPHEWQLRDHGARFDIDHVDDLRNLQANLPGVTVDTSIIEVLNIWQRSKIAGTAK